MKKAALIMAILLTLVLCSCQEQAKDLSVNENAIEIFDLGGTSDSSLNTEDKTLEYPLWSRESRLNHYDDSAPKTATVTFMGKTYEGTYKDSKTVAYATYQNDRYIISDGGIWFELNHDTGELVSIILSKPEKTTDILSSEECRTIADNLVKQYIDSPISDYNVTVDESEETSYYITYDKCCGKIKTNESIALLMSKYAGEIISFSTIMLNEYDLDELKTLEKSFEDLIKNSEEKISGKITSQYENDKKYKECEIDSRMLCKLPDGGYGVVVNANVVFEEPADVDIDGATSSVILRSGELKQFLVRYEDK